MPVAKKKPIRKKAAPARRGRMANPFDRKEEPSRHAVAALLIKKGPHTWEELKDAAGGTLSPRTMGAIIRVLEAEGARFSKRIDKEVGTVYELDPSAEPLANTTGPDATGVRSDAAPKAVAAKKKVSRKAAGKRPVRKAVSVPTKKAPAKRAAVVTRRPVVAKKKAIGKAKPKVKRRPR